MEDKKAVSLLSSAALFEERLHEPSLSRNTDRTESKPMKGTALSPLDAEPTMVVAGATVHEGDAIEAQEHQATAQRANELLSSLRGEPDMLKRARIVAEHTQENGGLPVRLWTPETLSIEGNRLALHFKKQFYRLLIRLQMADLHI